MLRNTQSLTFDTENHDFVFKIIAVGSGGVGKTSLIRRFAHNKFEESYLYTLGVDFTTKLIELGKYRIKLVCVDTAGQENYSKLRPNYYLGGNGALIVFDVTDMKSFEDVSQWLNELKQFIGDIPIVLVGNKIDRESERLIPKKEMGNTAKSYDMISSYETSAKLGIGVDDIFRELAIAILKKHEIEIED